MTARPRRAMTLQMMPDGARFNGVPYSIFPPAVFAALSVGDVLDNDEINPLIWSRQSELVS